MHIFLYEWATGGGLVEAPGALPASLVGEGAAMVGSLAADFAKIPGCQVTALRDPRMVQLALPRCSVVDVISMESHRDELERLASQADGTLLIAPEFDGILIAAARRVTAAGGRLLSPPPEFIRVAVWNKQGESCARFLGKGNRVGVQGRLRTHSWEDEGKRKTSVEVVARTVDFLTPAPTAPKGSPFEAAVAS